MIRLTIRSVPLLLIAASLGSDLAPLIPQYLLDRH